MGENHIETRSAYVTPKVDVLNISSEGLLCASFGYGLGVDNDPYEDGGIVDLFFL